MYLIDINTQLDILTKLSDALANPVMRDTGQTSRDSDGGESAETGKPDGIAPHISIYYEDIEKGYTYSYNPDEVMNPASMIKAPFVLSLFMEASKEERAIKEAESSGSAVPERVYDMTKKIVYTREQYYQPGSGEIQKSEDGTEYTYKDLFYYLLRYSDNVAYKILKDAFGTKFYSNLVVSLGATSMYKAPVGMSARDAAKCMRAVYNFIENDEYYGKFMKDALVGSAHQVLIANSVYPAAAAHKYGWDVGAYDDMAIVYDEHPYILVIMTDYDEGGKEVNEYLQNILGLIVQMHKNFYKER